MDSIASPTREIPAATGCASRILLVDGHQIFRHALRMLLADNTAFNVIGECGTARGALELAEVLQPGVVITELQLPDRQGVELIEQLRARQPSARILVLTTLRARERVAAARRAGALGYRTREIAQMLGVSVRAIYRQRESLRNTLQLNSTAALTRFAVYEGIAEDCPAER